MAHIVAQHPKETELNETAESMIRLSATTESDGWNKGKRFSVTVAIILKEKINSGQIVTGSQLLFWKKINSDGQIVTGI